MKRTLTVIAVAVAAAAAGGAWYLHAKQPLRNGSLALAHLQAPVDVRYDERGVPHLYAQNQTDLYRALGYVHAQDRLFQMEMLRRLARGELAEVLGPKLVDTDRLFRTLRIRDHAAEYSARQDKQSQPWKVLEAYLDGVNQFQENNPAPLEFDLLDIPRRPFTPEDTLSIAGYMAYSFAAAFRTEPVLTYIRDELGQRLPAHLRSRLASAGRADALRRTGCRRLEGPRRPRPSQPAGPGGRRPAAVRGQQRLGRRRQPHRQRQAPAGRRPAYPLRRAGGMVRGPAERARLRTLWPPPGAQPLRLAGPQPCVRLEPDDVPERRPRPGRREGQPGQPQPGLVPGRMGRPAERGAGNRGQGRCAGEAHPAPLAPRSDRQRRARRQLRQDPDRHVVGFPRDREPGARRLLPAESRRYPGQGPRGGLEDPFAGTQPGLGQRRRRYRLVGLGGPAEAAGGGEPELHPRRQQGRGGQVRLLSVRRQPTGGKPGARLYRLRQLPAGPGQWPADSRLLQPGGPRPVAGYPTGRPRHQMEPGQQPRAATRQSHRLRATPARTLAAGPARGGRRRRRQAPGRATGGLERRLPGRLDRRHAVQPVAVPDCRGRLARRTGAMPSSTA